MFPTEEGLYRYIVKRNADVEGAVILELQGVPASGDDFDADHGALLVQPKKIIGSKPVDRQRLAATKGEVIHSG